VKPLSEYIDRLSDETVEVIEWTFDILSDQVYRLYEGDNLENVYEIPYGLLPREPFVGRRDLFEEAGLSFEDDFHGLEDYNHLIEVAQTLQDESSASFGYPVYGSTYDSTDTQLVPWTVSRGGNDGLYLNEDGTDTNMDNDVWKQTVREYVEVHTEHELSPPNAAQLAWEDVVPMLISGELAIGSIDYLAQGNLEDQASELLETGALQYTTGWEGEAGVNGLLYSFPTIGIARKPEGVSEEEWRRKEDAALQFIDSWFTSDFQSGMLNNFGIFPVRQDVWDGLTRTESNFVQSGLDMIQQSEHSVAAHPGMAEFFSTIPAPHMQDALNGNITPEEACDNIAEEVRAQL
jgi:ABC-type glycerol-3-phosphate transport system substrate-binding protein